MNSCLLNLSVVACFQEAGTKLPGADRSDTLDVDPVLVAGQFGPSSSITPSSPRTFLLLK
jgi:hypothetical protein